MSDAIGILILAAGASSRMGTPKQLLPYGDTTLLRRTLDAALASSCRPIIIVTGANAGKVTEHTAGLPVRRAHNEHWKDGLGTSIGCGITCLVTACPNAAGAIILLSDQPTVTSNLINRLLPEDADVYDHLSACQYGDSLGVPAFFGRNFFDQLSALEGDQGAKKILFANQHSVRVISVGEIVDIDTPEDYNRVKI